LGAGLSKVAGKLFRIGHLGDMNEVHLMAGINGAEMAMLDCGIKVKPGRRPKLTAVQKFYSIMVQSVPKLPERLWRVLQIQGSRLDIIAGC